MKIEEIERLAVAATARIWDDIPVDYADPQAYVRHWRESYKHWLAEFIEQERAERAK